MQLKRMQRLFNEGKPDHDLLIEKLKKKYETPINSDMAVELDQGVEEEKEHDNLYSFLVDYLEAKDVEFPLSENEFYEWIAAAHLLEDQNYYSKLEEAMKK